jgi:acyl carrier protein
MSLISSRVKNIILEHYEFLELQQITERADFYEDFGFEEVDFIELILHCEKEYTIAIPDEDALKMKTVGDLINYLEQNVPNGMR